MLFVLHTYAYKPGIGVAEVIRLAVALYVCTPLCVCLIRTCTHNINTLDVVGIILYCSCYNQVSTLL